MTKCDTSETRSTMTLQLERALFKGRSNVPNVRIQSMKAIVIVLLIALVGFMIVMGAFV